MTRQILSYFHVYLCLFCSGCQLNGPVDFLPGPFMGLSQECQKCLAQNRILLCEMTNKTTVISRRTCSLHFTCSSSPVLPSIKYTSCIYQTKFVFNLLKQIYVSTHYLFSIMSPLCIIFRACIDTFNSFSHLKMLYSKVKG